MLGIAVGLALALPTLQYETQLFERVADALNGGTAESAVDARPPVDVARVIDALSANW